MECDTLNEVTLSETVHVYSVPVATTADAQNTEFLRKFWDVHMWWVGTEINTFRHGQMVQSSYWRILWALPYFYLCFTQPQEEACQERVNILCLIACKKKLPVSVCDWPTVNGKPLATGNRRHLSVSYCAVSTPLSKWKAIHGQNVKNNK